MAQKQSKTVTKLVSAFRELEGKCQEQTQLLDEILHHAGPELCKQLIKDRGDKDFLFIIACFKESFDLMEFLITECHANIERHDKYLLEGEVMYVTQLWHAAAKHQIKLVKRLAEFGASVNARAKSGETPLMRACTNNDFEMVQLLVSLGADIYQTDNKGNTCLMKALHSPPICRHLLDHGADNINAQNAAGNTALHNSMGEGDSFETTALLLDYNADPHILNVTGEDVLLTACFVGDEESVQLLRDKHSFATEHLASCLEVLGSLLWAFGPLGNYERVFSYWQEACTLRSQSGLSKRVLPAVAQYDWLTEFADQAELDSLGENSREMALQSLLICERVLGAKHYQFHYVVIEVASTLIEDDEIKAAATYLKYSFELQISELVWLNADDLLETMLILLVALGVQDIDPVLSFEEALYVLLKLIWMHKKLSSYPKRRVSADEVVTFCPLILQYIMSLPRTPAQEFELRRSLCCALHYDGLVKASGESLLHVSVGKYIVEKDKFLLECSYVPDVELIRLLLDCGPRVDELDRNLNTPLHKAVQAENYNKEIVDLLLARGAHIDRCNVFGVTPLSMLPTRSNNELQLTSLKCLAARVVQKYGLSSESNVPRELHKFAKFH